MKEREREREREKEKQNYNKQARSTQAVNQRKKILTRAVPILDVNTNQTVQKKK